MTASELDDLETIYKHILLDPALLVESAARKQTTVRAIFESVVGDLEEIAGDRLRLTTNQEGVKERPKA